MPNIYIVSVNILQEGHIQQCFLKSRLKMLFRTNICCSVGFPFLCFFQVSLEAVRSLGLLMEGSAGHGKPAQPIHQLLTKGPLQTQAGYSPVSHSFTMHKLLSCLQHSLILNPFGITACLRSGKKLTWAQQGVWESSDIVAFYVYIL